MFFAQRSTLESQITSFQSCQTPWLTDTAPNAAPAAAPARALPARGAPAAVRRRERLPRLLQPGAARPPLPPPPLPPRLLPLPRRPRPYAAAAPLPSGGWRPRTRQPTRSCSGQALTGCKLCTMHQVPCLCSEQRISPLHAVERLSRAPIPGRALCPQEARDSCYASV